MKIETQISEKEYLKLMMTLFYKKPIFIIFNLIGIILLVCYFLEINLEGTEKTPIYYLLFALFFSVINPLIFYYSMKKQIRSNKELTEKTIYTFSENSLCMEGIDSKTEIPWNEVYNIIENKNWILIYLDKKSISFIPKSAFRNKIVNFRNLYKGKLSN